MNQEVRSLLEQEKKSKGRIDVELIHEHGCTFDTCGLPHHISQPEEVDMYIRELSQIIERLKLQPKVITISR